MGIVILGFVLLKWALPPQDTDLGPFERVTGIEVADVFEDHPWLLPNMNGDGAVFMALAADLSAGEGHLVNLKVPVFRYSRVGFSVAAWLVSLGQDPWIPAGMLLVNLVSIGFLAWIGDRYRFGLLLVGNPSVIIGFLGGSAEPFALALLTAALIAPSPWSFALGATRPSYLVALLDQPRKAAMAAISAVLVRLVAAWIFSSSFFEGGTLLVFPLTGYLQANVVHAWLLAAVGIFMVGLGWSRRQWSWVATGALVLCLGPVPVRGFENAWRVTGLIWPLLVGVGRPGVGQQITTRSSTDSVTRSTRDG